jgi:hypothetical protein
LCLDYESKCMKENVMKFYDNVLNKQNSLYDFFEEVRSYSHLKKILHE